MAKKTQAKSTKKSTKSKVAVGKKVTPKKKTTKSKVAAIHKAKTTKKTTKKTAAAKTTEVASASAKEAKTAPKAAITTTAAAPSAPPKPAPRPEPTAPQRREPLSEAQLRKVKTGLTRKDIENYRQLLIEKRLELLGDVAALEVDVRNAGGNMFNPEHMADVGSDNYEQEFTLGLVESERKMLAEINEALMRIKSRTYGVCVESGVPIARARLDAKPWAKYCIEVVRERERRGQF